MFYMVYQPKIKAFWVKSAVLFAHKIITELLFDYLALFW